MEKCGEAELGACVYCLYSATLFNTQRQDPEPLGENSRGPVHLMPVNDPLRGRARGPVQITQHSPLFVQLQRGVEDMLRYFGLKCPFV